MDEKELEPKQTTQKQITSMSEFLAPEMEELSEAFELVYPRESIEDLY